MADEKSSSSSEPTDEWLMKKFAEGNDEHFSTLYRRYSGRVYGYLRKKIRDQNIADEIFQEVFLKVVKSRRSFTSDGHFAPWLFSIVRHSMIDRLRRQVREDHASKALALDPTLNVSENTIEEAPRDLEDLLGSLTEKEKMVLTLRYVDDLPFSSVASKTGFSLANVRQIASRAMSKLRKRGV